MNAVTKKKKRLLRFSAISIVAAAAAVLTAWLTVSASETCGLVDRLRERSGCVRTWEIQDFRPLFRQTMSNERPDGTVTLLGWSSGDARERSRPTLVRFDLGTGREIERTTLAIGDAFDHAVISHDGARALLACSSRNDCAGDGTQAAVVATADGTQIALVGQSEPYPRTIPGDALPTVSDRYSTLTDNGSTSVEVDNYGDLVLMRSDGKRVTELLSSKDRGDLFAPRFAVSPDRSAIVVRLQSRQSGDRFHVWNTLTGAAIARFLGSSSYKTASNPAWAADSRAIYSIRASGSRAFIDKFTIPHHGR